jgi:hypothetical protein
VTALKYSAAAFVFALLGQTGWHRVHGGIEWSDHAHGLDDAGTGEGHQHERR